MIEIRVEKEKWVKGIAVDDRLTRRAVLRMAVHGKGRTSSSRSHTYSMVLDHFRRS